MKSSLLTHDPVALKALLQETIFVTSEPAHEEISMNEDAQSVSTPEKTDQTFVFQGNKDHGILFILRYEQYPYFSPKADEAFQKTIGALGLSLENVAVLNLANPHNPNEWKKIMAFFLPKKIILLGVEPKSLQLPAIAHNSYMHGKIATVFNTFSFEEMFVDIEKKKAFWGEFKKFLSESK